MVTDWPRANAGNVAMSPTGTSATIIEWLCLTAGWTARISKAVDGDAGAVIAKLICASNMSLDGWTENDRGAGRRRSRVHQQAHTVRPAPGGRRAPGPRHPLQTTQTLMGAALVPVAPGICG